MHDLPTDWSALCALVFLLGMRHGFDADHLATIDGYTRPNSRQGQRHARWCGALFSLGHGVVVMAIALVMGSLMYVVEGERAGFNSIPDGIYWAIVTMTTVGYGDLAPQSALGKFLASLLMLIGYSIIAIPTGIVSVEIAQAHRVEKESRVCPGCGRPGHEKESAFCRFCGGKLNFTVI